MAYETLLVTREETFAVVTLNRPPANAISEQLVRDLDAAMTELAADGAVRSVIVTGAGDKIFCAGADLGSAFSGGTVEDFIRFGNGVLRKIERFGKPVIAALNGHALGGGCEIAMACHLRILKETARMGQTESNLGIIPGYGGTQRLPRLIGWGKAKELILTGEIVDAREAERLGLVSKVVPRAQLRDTAREYARRMLARGPLALRLAKLALNMSARAGLDAGLQIERLAQAVLFESKDKYEGMTAFLEKRKPNFTGE